MFVVVSCTDDLCGSTEVSVLGTYRPGLTGRVDRGRDKSPLLYLSYTLPVGSSTSPRYDPGAEGPMSDLRSVKTRTTLLLSLECSYPQSYCLAVLVDRGDGRHTGGRSMSWRDPEVKE